MARPLALRGGGRAGPPAAFGGVLVLLALARCRPLVVAIAVGVALVGFAAPALAGLHDHCVDGGDQHCPPALIAARPLPAPALLGFAGSPDVTLSPPIVSSSIFKIPLAAWPTPRLS